MLSVARDKLIVGFIKAVVRKLLVCVRKVDLLEALFVEVSFEKGLTERFGVLPAVVQRYDVSHLPLR
jgi:hypothetical protein